MSPPDADMAGFTVVICHGSYHTPRPYEQFMTALHNRGVDAHCPQLPTSDLTLFNVGDVSSPDYNRDIPPNGYPQPSDDVKVIQDLLNRLIEREQRKVLLIGHSSGGPVATQAATPPLLAKTRKAKNERGGIIGIFYECAFLIPVGQSVHSFFQPPPGTEPVIPPYCQFHKHGLDGVASAINGAQYFFNGVNPTDAECYASTLTASPVFKTELTNDAYTALPLAYLVCDDDQALPAAYQDQMIAGVKQREGVDIKVLRAPSGHSPHLAWKDGLVDAVIEFAQQVGDLKSRRLPSNRLTRLLSKLCRA